MTISIFQFILLFQTLLSHESIISICHAQEWEELDFAPSRSRSPDAMDIDYGGNHPWEYIRLGRKERRTKNKNEFGQFFRPIRIKFILPSGETIKSYQKEDPVVWQERYDTFVRKILPQAQLHWNTTLKTVPVRGNLVIGLDPREKRENSISNCPVIRDPEHIHSTEGIPHADLAIYVDLGEDKCSNDESLRLPHGLVCELDQFDRPIAGECALHVIEKL